MGTAGAGEWTAASSAEIPDIEKWLIEREWCCVSFTSHLADRRYESLRVCRRDGQIAGTVMLGPHGLVLPVLGPQPPELPADLVSPRADSLTVMGEESSVVAAERRIGRPCSRTVSYNLMRLEVPWSPAASGPRAAAPASVAIRRAGLRDLSRLYPLQCAYEKEEVLLDPSAHSPRICRALLKRTLREQVVYLAERSGEAVAKAGTNARGIRYDQIGGVYTVPELRGQGIGNAVMRALLAELLRAKPGACLFVKKTNEPALALYLRLGFSMSGGYRISYYIP